MKHLVAAFLGYWLTVSSILHAAPANDDFANRFILEGASIVFTGTLSGATVQWSWSPPNVQEFENFNSDCELGVGGGGKGTVWWEWTAPNSTTGIIEVVDYSTNSFRLGSITVIRGTNGLNCREGNCPTPRVGCTSLDSGRRSYAQFAAIAGEKYQIRVYGPEGTFTLRLTATNAPHFLIHPVTQSAMVGSNVFFGGLAVGPSPVSYQWRFNGVDLPGQNWPVLPVKHLTTNQAGDYVLVASNAGNVVASLPARLFVTALDVQPELTFHFQDGKYMLGINGETGRMYRIESSTDLVTWAPEVSFPDSSNYYGRRNNRVSIVFNTNGLSQFELAPAIQPKFFRAFRYHHSNDECGNNLKMTRFAKELWMMKYVPNDIYATPPQSELAQFMGPLPVCPSGGEQYTPGTIASVPLCVSVPWPHYLEEPEY